MKNLNVRYLNKDEFAKWDEFVDNSPQGNIFNKSYWLEAVSSNFDILIAEENDKIVGGIALPYMKGKLYRTPKLTSQLGVLYMKQSNKNLKYYSILSKEMEICSAIIKSIPKFNMFGYNFSYKFSNCLPFIWEGYNVEVHYTYMIDDLSNIDSIYSDFKYGIRRDIQKAINSGIKVSDKYSIEDFFEVNKKTYDRQGMEIPYTLDFLKSMDTALAEHGNRKMLFALNEENVIIAAVYLMYDKNCTYYLMGGADPKYRDTGVQMLLVWEGIKFAAGVSKVFDFEGSMVKSIEKVFREFGGKQKVIYNVNKSNKVFEIIYKIASKNKNIIRKIIKV